MTEVYSENDVELPSPTCCYRFEKSVNLSFMLEFKSDVIKDVSSAKMFPSFAAVKVLTVERSKLD